MTRLLRAWSGGKGDALAQMVPLVEAELRKVARGYLRSERADHTLQTTALINEAYLRLVDQQDVAWQNRAHFFGIAARMMRRILVDHARKRKASKRGGAAEDLPLEEAAVLARNPGADTADVVAVHDALSRLEELDPRQAEIVELKIFGGLKNDEIAAVLEVSRTTVKREWQAARAWLHRELS